MCGQLESRETRGPHRKSQPLISDREEQVLAVRACGPPVCVREPPRARLGDVRDLRRTDQGQATNAHAAEGDWDKSQRMPRNSRDSQIGVRSIDNDKTPAVPLACAGTRCVQLARLLRFPPELSKDSRRRRLGGALAGTAEAVSGTATASFRLKAPRSLRGIFGIVSSASDRAAAEGKTD